MTFDVFNKAQWPEVEVALRENRRELVVSNQEGSDPLIYFLKQLNFLDISKCKSFDLSDEVGNLCELTKLSLQHNAMLKLPTTIGSLKNLSFLDFSYNVISSLPFSIFDNLSLLDTLLMDSNHLTELPSLKGLVNLHHLSVSNNSLSVFPESVIDCTKLMTIDVSNNKILELSNDLNWGNLANLHSFNLSKNKLSSVPVTLTLCKKLRDLQLHENPLKDSRLRKLVAHEHPGPSLISYLGKPAKGKENAGNKSSNASQGTTNHRQFKPPSTDSSVFHDLVISPNADNENYVVRVVRPEEVRKGLRPRIFACVVSGICLSEEGALVDFMRFQTKLHCGPGEHRSSATVCTHDFKQLTLPLTFALQPVDVVYIHPLNMKKLLTGRQLLTHLQLEAESERKRRKMTTFSGLMRYLELVSPLLGPGRKALSGANNADIQPLPATTDATGTVISLHPITGCHETRLTRDTTELLIEVAGKSDEVCKTIIRALLGWLLQFARPKEGDCPPPHPLTICPLTIANSGTGDRFAVYPTAADITAPDFLNVKVD